MEASWPIIIKGCSTGWPPIHVRIIMSAISSQNSSWDSGRYARVRCFERCIIGTIKRIRIEKSRAKTPPSLFGIERRIA